MAASRSGRRIAAAWCSTSINIATSRCTTTVDEPEQVGIDRLLDARSPRTVWRIPIAAVVISVGTAVTIDLVDAKGVFQGGVILPGPRLMAESLHEHTAKLPLVDAAILPTVDRARARTPATRSSSGIRAAIVGAAVLLVNHYADHGSIRRGSSSPAARRATSAASTFGKRFKGTRFVPTLTLEGIRIAAEALP